MRLWGRRIGARRLAYLTAELHWNRKQVEILSRFKEKGSWIGDADQGAMTPEGKRKRLSDTTLLSMFSLTKPTWSSILASIIERPHRTSYRLTLFSRIPWGVLFWRQNSILLISSSILHIKLKIEPCPDWVIFCPVWKMSLFPVPPPDLSMVSLSRGSPDILTKSPT